MHFCRAQIAIGGDMDNVYHADNFYPVSWPEIVVLQVVHGHDAISQIEPFVQVDQHPRAERQRLAFKYGETIVTEAFGKQNPNEMEAPRVKLLSGLQWMNPLSGVMETTGPAAPETPPAPEPEPEIPAEKSYGYMKKRA